MPKWLTRTNTSSWLAIISLSLLLPGIVFALDSDKQEKTYLYADQAEINKQTGIGVYTGNVKVDRGTTHVTGDKIITHSSKDNKITRIIIHAGKHQRAHFESKTNLNKPPLIAEADLIKYFPQKHYALLIGNAKARQGNDSIDGPYLKYDTEGEVLTAMNKPGKKGQAGRTTIIIEPDDIKSK